MFKYFKDAVSLLAILNTRCSKADGKSPVKVHCVIGTNNLLIVIWSFLHSIPATAVCLANAYLVYQIEKVLRAANKSPEKYDVPGDLIIFAVAIWVV